MVVIGVAYDGSEQGTKALQKALSIADPKRDIIHLIHAIDPPRTDPPFGLLPDEAEEELHRRKNKAMEMLKPVKDNLAKLGIKHKLHAQSGDPRTFVLFVVESEKLDFIFVGSRGLSELKGFFVGSTSQFVVHNAPCAVVVVK